MYHGYNINNYYAQYFKNVFAHKLYYYAYDSNIASSFLFLSFHVLRTQCACAIIPRGYINEYTYKNGVQFKIKSLPSLRYTCRPEFYNECDWNGARIIVIVQQTKK